MLNKPTPSACSECRGRMVHSERLGMCRLCMLCRFCGEYERAGKDTLYCVNCVCASCGADPRLTRMFRFPESPKQNICGRCYFQKFPDRACGNCRENEVMFFVWKAGEKKPKTANLCSDCAGSGKNLRCYYCAIPVRDARFTRDHRILVDGKISGKELYSVCCATCRMTRCCFRGECSPVRPCAKCRMLMNAHTPNPHEGPWLDNPVDLTRYLADAKSRRINRSARLLSAEIEIAGIRTERASDLFRKWASIRDHVDSIGGSIVYDESVSTGFEINMPPAAGDKFVELVEKTSTLLRGMGAYVNEKCGTHLHIDARDFTPLDMKKLLMLYSRIEPALLWTQPAERVLAKRSHCFPCGKKYASLESTPLTSFSPVDLDNKPKTSREWNKLLRHTLVDAVYGGDFPRPPRLMRGNNRQIAARYDALNVNSWYFQSHGTIECRLHAGTLAAKKIVAWGILWAAILDSAVKMTEAEVISLPKDQPKAVLLGLAPGSTHEYLMNRWNKFESEYEGKRY